MTVYNRIWCVVNVNEMWPMPTVNGGEAGLSHGHIIS